jgi:glutathione synthase/RimK-type ligase-like ATP-grasp enzyme
MKALFIGGVPDNGKADVVTTEQGSLSVVVSGSSNLAQFLTTMAGEKAQFFMAGQGGDQHYSLNFFPDVIINEISDADSHSFALKRCVAFCQQQGKPVINRPEAILATTREAIADKLQAIDGLQMPLTVRITPRSPLAVVDAIAELGLAYPVIFRAAGDHGGISTARIDSEADVVAACHAYALDGRAYYLTRFVDYRSADGLYRKYRLAVVAGQVFIRHLIISEQWLVHAGARNGSKQAQAEEAAALESFHTQLAPALQPAISSITEVLGLDYFGIDCAISDVDGQPRMLAFEVNANMNILVNPQPLPNIWQQPVTAIINALSRLIIERAGVRL